MRKWDVRKMVCAQVGRAQKIVRKKCAQKNCAQVGTNLNLQRKLNQLKLCIPFYHTELLHHSTQHLSPLKLTKFYDKSSI